MEDIIFNLGLGYLLGLGLLGYVFLLEFIRKQKKLSNWSNFRVNFYVFIHFIIGLLGIGFVPSTFFRNYQGEDIGKIIFGVIVGLAIFIIYKIVNNWEVTILKKSNS